MKLDFLSILMIEKIKSKGFLFCVLDEMSGLELAVFYEI